MSLGTVKLTNDSTTLEGYGTSFTTELNKNDFIVVTVGGIVTTLGVAEVKSDVWVILSVPYEGATTQGLNWQAVPAATLNLITSQLAAQVSYAIRANNLDRDNWQQIFSGTDDVTVRLPDNTSWTGPAWNTLSTRLNAVGDQISGKASKGANSDITSLSGLTTPLSLSQGGTGANNATGARNALGLGSAALLNDGLSSGAVLKREPGNVNATLNNPTAIFNWLKSIGFGSYQFTAAQAGAIVRYYPTLYYNAGNLHALLQTNYATGELISWGAVDNGGSWSLAQNILYGTANTTRATDGTIRAASPIVRIVKNKETCTRPDIDELDFQWCGAGVANAEAEGVTVERQSTGVYLLKGSDGLAKSGWQMSPPRDPQGSGDMGIVEAEQGEDGSLIIRLYKRRYVMTDDGDIEVAKGAPIDVPPTSWIDIRLDMPADSIWNINHPVLQRSAQTATESSEEDSE